MKLPAFAEQYRYELLLCCILALSAFLNLWNIWNQGDTNSYYAAAVKSALVNPWAGFFGSFDPAGFITVDKPPVGIWVQAAFAAVLGVQGWVLVLPQALAGIASVALIYAIISRPFGKPAGLVAALALAVTPILVAVSRNGTMDSQMIFVLLLAVWVVLKAAREQSLPLFLVSAALIGIAFNIKMIQAYIVVPAVLAVYFLGATELPFKKRVLHVGLAVLVLVAVSLSWALVVDSIPADQRPYIGGSGDNSVLGLVLNYNGAHRLGISIPGVASGGMGGMPGSGPGNSANGFAGRESGISGPPGSGISSFSGPGGSQDASGTLPGSGPGGAPGAMDNAEAPSGMTAPPGSGGSSFPTPGGSQDNSGSTPGAGQQAPPGMEQSGSSGSSAGSPPGGMGGGGGGMNSGGTPGLFRVFGHGLGGEIAWLLVFALIGVLAWVRKPRELSLAGLQEAGYFGTQSLTILAMLLWLIPGLMYFSFTSGFWHDYYIATIAPPIAGLVGIGALGMYRKYGEGGMAGWLLVAAVFATGLVQVTILSYDAAWAGLLLPLVLVGTLVTGGLLAWMQVHKTPALLNHRTLIIAAAIGLLFVAPLVWSLTPMMTGNGGTMPTAGPPGSRGVQGGGMPGGTAPGGMMEAGGMGIPVTATGNDAREMAGRDALGGSGNRTRPSDRTATGIFGTGTGYSGSGLPGASGGNRTSAGFSMSGGPGNTGTGQISTDTLAAYLLAHTTTETWILAVPSSQSGADLIITTGKPVMCLGGFMGSDQVLDLDSLKASIREGKVRFFMTGSGGGPGGGSSGISSWVSSTCRAVTVAEIQGSTTGTGSDNTSPVYLYDCLGAAGSA
jgi:4-amino-4-deoxy-L-arabinose transferase-like glycosyltransferase